LLLDGREYQYTDEYLLVEKKKKKKTDEYSLHPLKMILEIWCNIPY